jgi:NTP pyrophosphatase (non-canonical NTP hydrolase)
MNIMIAMGFKDFNEYQKKCKKTAIYPNLGKNFIYPTIGLMGEAGEVANKVKKIIRDDGGKITKEKKEELKSELGDVMWYTAQLSTELGLKLSDVAKYNLERLAKRKAEGKLHGSGDKR